MQPPPDIDEAGQELKKRSRIAKQLPKTHKVAVVHGRGLKELFRRIVNQAQLVKK